MVQKSSPYKMKVVQGITLRDDPAREACFTIVQNPSELADYADMSEVARRQRMHKHMHNELQAMEMAAACVAEFPDAPWELRMSLARQSWDESRHSSVLHRRLRQLGGRKGEFAVMNYEWCITSSMDSIWARIAIQNRTFESGEMDLLRRLSTMWSDAGDDVSAELLEGILIDEIAHVRFANYWFKWMKQGKPALLLELAKAVTFLKQVTAAFEPEPGTTNAAGVDLTAFEHMEVVVNVEDRLNAGFTQAEIDEVFRLEAALSKAVRPGTASNQDAPAPA